MRTKHPMNGLVDRQQGVDSVVSKDRPRHLPVLTNSLLTINSYAATLNFSVRSLRAADQASCLVKLITPGPHDQYCCGTLRFCGRTTVVHTWLPMDYDTVCIHHVSSSQQ